MTEQNLTYYSNHDHEDVLFTTLMLVHAYKTCNVMVE